MKFKYLKLFGMCSAVTLLFCFDADGMNWQHYLRNKGIREDNQRLVNVANTPVDLLKRGIVLEDVKKDESTKKPNNNPQNKSNSERTRSFNPQKPNNNAQNGGKPEGTRSFNPQKPNNNVQNGGKPEGTRSFNPQKPNNNPQNEANSANQQRNRNTKRSTVKKISTSKVVSEGKFSEWSRFNQIGVDSLWSEDKSILNSVNDYVYQLVDHGSIIERNGVQYGNQCGILALNLNTKAMSELYDEMDKFDDYGHNFADYVYRRGGLYNIEKNERDWQRISDIIRYRVGIYFLNYKDGENGVDDAPVTGLIYGDDSLPIKRIYLENGHYRELLINKNPNSEISGQRNGEKQRKETETPKPEEKLETVEDNPQQPDGENQTDEEIKENQKKKTDEEVIEEIEENQNQQSDGENQTDEEVKDVTIDDINGEIKFISAEEKGKEIDKEKEKEIDKEKEKKINGVMGRVKEIMSDVEKENKKISDEKSKNSSNVKSKNSSNVKSKNSSNEKSKNLSKVVKAVFSPDGGKTWDKQKVADCLIAIYYLDDQLLGYWESFHSNIREINEHYARFAENKTEISENYKTLYKEFSERKDVKSCLWKYGLLSADSTKIGGTPFSGIKPAYRGQDGMSQKSFTVDSKAGSVENLPTMWAQANNRLNAWTELVGASNKLLDEYKKIAEKNNIEIDSKNLSNQDRVLDNKLLIYYNLNYGNTERFAKEIKDIPNNDLQSIHQDMIGDLDARGLLYRKVMEGLAQMIIRADKVETENSTMMNLRRIAVKDMKSCEQTAETQMGGTFGKEWANVPEYVESQRNYLKQLTNLMNQYVRALSKGASIFNVYTQIEWFKALPESSSKR